MKFLLPPKAFLELSRERISYCPLRRPSIINFKPIAFLAAKLPAALFVYEQQRRPLKVGILRLTIGR